MYLDVFDRNAFSTNCWMVAAEGSDEAVVVDPGFGPEEVHETLRLAGKRPVAVLATHGHFDHIGSAAVFCGDDLPLYVHEADRAALTDPGAWGSGMPVPSVEVKDVRTVVEGDELGFGGFTIRVMHTPGHTPGSVCYLTDGFVFSGDLVFAGSIGRSDFPNSSPRDMELSLRRFLELRDELPVYPGHGPGTTVGRERRSNPFLVELR
ncbi:MAG: MBL fold metallo-hydrolase [Actinobacteria bacterium]|nr:MBL fold metallo-hydrolase [Actinomycetota bacterium]